MTRGPSAAYLLVTLLGLFVFFFGLGSCGIFDLDEGLYVEAAREMRTGDSITPRVDNQPFFEKPPLIYWLSAASMILFGRNEFTARLPSALASLLTALLILWFGTRVFGLRTGTLAACMFTLSPIVFGEARQLTTDATLNLLLTGAMIALFLAWFDSPRRSRNALILWALCGIGMLAKGLPGILIPVLAACLFALSDNNWSFKPAAKSLLRLRPIIGALLFLAIATPWHIAAYRQSGEAFTQEYVIRQHLGRFRGGDTAHRAPFWFYIPGFMLGMFPWSFFVPAALLGLTRKSSHNDDAQLDQSEGEERGNRSQPELGGVRPGDCATDSGRPESLRTRTARKGNPRGLYLKLVGEGSAGSEQATGSGQVGAARRLLAIWSVLVFVLFSLSGSKLISYILPMYGPAALLAADWYVRFAESCRQSTQRIAIVLAAATSIVFLIVLNYRSIIHLIESRTHRPVSRESITPEVIAFVIHLLGMAALACLLFLIASRYRRQLAMPALTVGMVGFFAVAILEGLPAIDSAFLAPLHRLAAKATSGDFGHIILSSVPRRPSAIFYMPDEIHLKDLLLEPKPDKLAETMRTQGASISAIVTQSKTASAVAGIEGFQVVESAGGWALLERP